MKESGVKPAYVPLRNPFQQALFIAQRIEELAGEGTPLRDMAVLYRAHHLSTELQMEMTKRGIPFELRSGIRFVEQAHVRDVTACLRIFDNPMDEAAWRRILRLQRGIGAVGAEKIWNSLSGTGKPLEALLSPDFLPNVRKNVATSLAGLQRLLKALIPGSGPLDPGKAVLDILDGGYREYMKEAFSDPEAREGDLVRLSRFAARFSDLAEFLSELALMGGQGEENDRIAAGGRSEKVILGTVHQAKGLEWAVVFIAWCTEGMFPLYRVLDDPKGIEEERRLFYVAVTRAKDQLYLCHPVTDSSRGFRRAPLRPSRFIRELVPSFREGQGLPFEEWFVEEG